MFGVLLLWIACNFLGEGFNVWPVPEDIEMVVFRSLVYASVFVIFAHAGWIAALILFASHLVIHLLIGRISTYPFIIDQILHIIVIVLLVLLLVH